MKPHVSHVTVTKLKCAVWVTGWCVTVLSACVDAVSGVAVSPAPGCVFMSGSFLLSRCAYKTDPDAAALVIKA